MFRCYFVFVLLFSVKLFELSELDRQHRKLASCEEKADMSIHL